jgi:hypothetical protein
MVVFPVLDPFHQILISFIHALVKPEYENHLQILK